MSRTRVLIADDHRMFLEGLRRLLEDEFELVGTAGDGAELVELAKRLCPDIVIADVRMPKLNGIEAVRQLHEHDERILVVLLTMYENPAYAVSALEAGAAGYVLKHAAPDELLEAIHDALQGRCFVSPALADEVMKLQGRRLSELPAARPELSRRQRDVVRLTADGLTAKEVAQRLGLSQKTVEYHKYRTMKLLGCTTSADLLRYALTHGLAGASPRDEDDPFDDPF